MSKLPCKTCGVTILPETASRNDGECVPCRSGTRKRIETAKQRYREERKREQTDPFRKLWRELVQCANETPNGLESLSEPERQYLAVGLLEGEVYNGGFDQYFFNSSGDYYRYAIDGLVAMGATRSLELLRQAIEIVFGLQEPIADTERRREFLRGRVDDPCSKKLNELDLLFWKDQDCLGIKAEEFARDKGIVGAT